MADPQLQDYQQNVRIPLVSVEDTRSSSPGFGSYQLDQNFFNCFPQVNKHPVTGESEFSVVKRNGVNKTSLDVSGSFDTASHNCTALANIGISQLNDVCIGAWFETTANKIHIIQYRPGAATTTKIGSITGCTVGDSIFFTEVMLTTSYIPGIAITWIKADKSTSEGYYAQSSGGVFTAASLTNISDADFPANTPADLLVGPMQQLNGYFYVMARSGKIYQSDNAYNITAWGTRIIDTYAYPDKGVGIWRYKHHLVAFSDTTVEFFNDSGARGDGGTLPSSLERTEQAFIKFGAAGAKWVKNIDDVLYWVSASDTSTTGMWKLDGYTPIKVSKNKQDSQIIANFSSQGAANAFGGSMESILLNGYKHLLLMMPTSSRILAYATNFTKTSGDPYTYSSSEANVTMMFFCLDTNMWWSGRDYSNLTTSLYWLPCAYYNDTTTTTPSKTDQYILKFNLEETSTDAKAVYSVLGGTDSPNLEGDTPVGGTIGVTNPITVMITTNTLDFDNANRKFIRKARLVADNIFREGGDSDTPYIYLILDKQDGTSGVAASYTFLTYRQMSRAIDFTNQRIYFNQVGSFRRGAFMILFKSKTSFRAKYLELMVQQGSH
jgi:hypothetical protein